MSPLLRRALCAGFALSFAATASADEPFILMQQGRLLDRDNTPVEGTVDLHVRIYANFQAPPGETETPLWQASFPATPVTNGLYVLQLGVSENARLSPELLSAERWLSVQVGTGPELTPRLRLGAVARALHAADAAALGGKPPAFYLDAANLTGEVADENVASAGAWHDKLDAVAVNPPLSGNGRAGSALTIDFASSTKDGALKKEDFATFAAKVDPNDPRLTNAREPLPGSAHYVQVGTTAQQGNLNLTGTGTFGALDVLGGLKLTSGDAPGAPGTCSSQDAGRMLMVLGRLEVCDGAFWNIAAPRPALPVRYGFDSQRMTDEAHDPTANRARAGTAVTWVPPVDDTTPGDGCHSGGCVRFSGAADSYITIPAELLHGLTAFTISYWARGTPGRPDSYVFSVWTPRTDNYLLVRAPNDDTLSHFVVRRDAEGVLQVFRDGDEDNWFRHSTTSDPVLQTANGAIVLGQDQDERYGRFQTSQAFIGTLDELRILPYALTDAQIAAGNP